MVNNSNSRLIVINFNFVVIRNRFDYNYCSIESDYDYLIKADFYLNIIKFKFLYYNIYIKDNPL